MVKVHPIWTIGVSKFDFINEIIKCCSIYMSSVMFHSLCSFLKFWLLEYCDCNMPTLQMQKQNHSTNKVSLEKEN